MGRQLRGLARSRGMPQELDPHAARRDASDGPPVLRRLGHRGADADAHRARRRLEPARAAHSRRAHRRARRDHSAGWSRTRTVGPTGSTSTATIRTSSSPACRNGRAVARRARSGRLLHFCYWQVQPDEALVIRVVPPRCAYWNFELGNYWMNSADYRYRLSSLNSEQAVVEDDGSVVIVVAHHDPGVPNWLDTAGHTVGLMPQRWVEADSSPTPSATLVHVRRSRRRARSRACSGSTNEERHEQLRVAQDRRRPTVPDVTRYREVGSHDATATSTRKVGRHSSIRRAARRASAPNRSRCTSTVPRAAPSSTRATTKRRCCRWPTSST